jgi:glycerol-3-phosphate dehydrogenase subunit B
MEAEVIVIGGGMAGTVAALRAADLGAEVILIRKGFGATAMSSGTIDIAGPTGFLPLDPWDSLPSIHDRLGEILRTSPLHPYSIIAGGRDRAEHLQSALSQACDFLLGKAPFLKLKGSVERNLALPNIFGTAKFCALAPESMTEGDLLAMRDAHVLLVGINGLPSFRSHICKQSLARYCSMHPPVSISRVDVIEAGLSSTMEAQPGAPFEIAGRLDEPQMAEDFVRGLQEKIESDITHVGFPPVLGLNNHAEVYEIFSRELQPKVFELISPTFSIPGHRLQLSIETALRDNNVRVVTAEVVAVKSNGSRIEGLDLEDMRTKLTATAKNYVVATGKFSSGGLVAGDFPRESIFGLPVFVKDKCVDKKFVQDLFDSEIGDRQPFLSCGIHVDNSLRPIDPFDNPVFENLFAAGSLIGEYDYVNEKCGFGVAILTGYLAGAKAIE